ncbi:MAG: organic solvent tolerance protein OstA [Bacteroidales bacterium]|nr:organic solvent tolerance protein OstA [Bacteroidales bacterium]
MTNIRFIIFLFILIMPVSLVAQRQVQVKIERADYLRHDDKIGKNTQSLNGNVVLSHGRTFLYCDSAYMYNDSNVVVAYGSIHIIQNDSIHLYGDHLTYLGNQNLAKVRDNVRANKGETWLYTEFLDYDRLLDKAYFYNGGRVVNHDNVLTSVNGVYYPNTNEVFFKDSVVGTSPTRVMYSDTMSYNTRTEIVNILGETTIYNSDSTIIKSERGWYNTITECAQLNLNNTIISGANTLVGDHIFYNRHKGTGTATGHMVLTDSTNNMSILGDYGFYNQITGEALATRHAEVQHVYGGDTLFMHADTLYIEPLPADTSRLLKAYHKVKFFRTDMQGRCDSLIFDFRDSVATMYEAPILWGQGNQMTAHEIKMYTRNRSVYKSELIDAAFVISPEVGVRLDTIGYNQVKGKLITGYIRNNEIYRIDVDGNGQTIYYPKDDEALIGINRAESSNLTIFMKQRKVANIVMRVSPTGNMNPPILLGEKDRQLKGFRWLDDYRPRSRADIFRQLTIPDDMNIQEEVYEGYTFDELGE